MMVEWAAKGALRVRHEEVECGVKARIAYVSDMHLNFGWAERLIPDLIDKVREANPDVLLLGGDLVDSDRGLPILEDVIRDLSRLCPVLAIAGNHDPEEAVRSIVEDQGGIWIGSGRYHWQNQITFDGPGAVPQAPGHSSLRVLCSHYPNVFPEAVKSGYQLVFAGHLHGCQWVFWETRKGLYPGKWFYKWNVLRHEQQDAAMLVSRGVNDSFPLRINCPREILICDCV